jgi:hypothetical protein
MSHPRFPNGQISNRYHQCLSNELKATVVYDAGDRKVPQHFVSVLY